MKRGLNSIILPKGNSVSQKTNWIHSFEVGLFWPQALANAMQATSSPFWWWILPLFTLDIWLMMILIPLPPVDLFLWLILAIFIIEVSGVKTQNSTTLNLNNSEFSNLAHLSNPWLSSLQKLCTTERHRGRYNSRSKLNNQPPRPVWQNIWNLVYGPNLMQIWWTQITQFGTHSP